MNKNPRVTEKHVAMGLLVVTSAATLVHPLAALAVGFLSALLFGLVWLDRNDNKYEQRLQKLEAVEGRLGNLEKAHTEDHILLVKIANATQARR